MPEVVNLLAAPAVPLPTDAMQIYRPAATPGVAPTPLVGTFASLVTTLGGRLASSFATGNDSRFPDELALVTIDASRRC